MSELDFQAYKESQVRTLTTCIGVYALCDLDQVPIYVGQTVSVGERGIRGRVRRHLTSARSDPIANRQIDVWEIAYVWSWEVPEKRHMDSIEQHFIYQCNKQSPLVNETIPTAKPKLTLKLPERNCVQVMPEALIKARQDPTLRFPRQIQHFNQLVDYILNTQDKPHLRRALQVYYKRLTRYYQTFLDK
ncbi:GIY-YIG nuclease family protein [Planctomycetales bacterium ZRK34]|nr:GIY-YIG nuclease family protein [Planctomycetales bacterium ZRK34]